MADGKNKNPYGTPKRPWLAVGQREMIKADTTGTNTMYSDININKHGRPIKTAADVKSDIEKHVAEWESQRKRNKK